MTTLNPFFYFLIFIIAFVTAFLINYFFKFKNKTTRYESIDGLRGFLAISVFAHHAVIWYQYLHINRWESPKSNLYAQLGQSSVSFFFMITSFLFISKLIHNRETGINWKHFFVSRFFRLVPMYYFSLIILIFSVMKLSNWKIIVGNFKFISSIFHWGIFTILKNISINNLESTNILNSGVIWSLPFEWLFYFSLPLVGFFLLKSKPSKTIWSICITFILIYIFKNGLSMEHLISFFGGAIVPLTRKYYQTKINLQTTFYSFVVILFMILVLFFESSRNIFCKSLLICIFVILASGNNLFGVLKNATLQLMGEISYSTYLLHGLLISNIVFFGIGFENCKQISETEYCYLILKLTPILIICSFLGYVIIEKPSMKFVQKWIQKTNL